VEFAGLFHLLTSGATLFGLIELRAARRLGNISYGIYLLQGLVPTLLLPLPRLKALAVASPDGFWLATALCALVLTLMSAAAYALPERPGIRLGKTIAHRACEHRFTTGVRALARGRKRVTPLSAVLSGHT
jgi:peptidoglycan/LPS O-acetylase OafA/YrhL